MRNRLKIYSVRNNARVFLQIQQEFGSFSAYVWDFVHNSPIKGNYATLNDVPVSTTESDALSKDLKKRGMSFVGSTIMYAYMQAVGLVNDHVRECFCYAA
jgi:DNA-3-methyladenine glycosylase I